MATKMCRLSYSKAIDIIKDEDIVYIPWFIDGNWEEKLEFDGEMYDPIGVQEAIDKITNSSFGADVWEADGKFIIDLPCSAFMSDVIHCIGNNSRNDNFKFRVRASNEEEELEVINHTIEYKQELIDRLRKIIGKCEVERTVFEGCPAIIVCKVK